jgi:hypothetical protein
MATLEVSSPFKWLFNRLQLEPEERVLRSKRCACKHAHAALRGWQSGELFLTDKRLIWIGPIWVSNRTFTPSDVLGADVKENDFFSRLSYRWGMEIKAADRTHLFSFPDLRPEVTKQSAEEWAQAIKQWANI